MADLPEIIRTKQAELVEAEALVLRLRKELDAARELLVGPIKPLPPKSLTTSTEMAEHVLRAAGQPLHVSEIISAIERDYGVRVRYATLVGNLSRAVAKTKTFQRTGRNIYGLLDWVAEAFERELFERERADRLEAEMHLRDG